MKRLLVFLLAVCMLTGCSRKKGNSDSENTPPSIEGVEYRYITGSSVEKRTDGAVRVYDLKDDTYFGLYGVGSNLLVLGQKYMTALTGEWGEMVAESENADVRSGSVTSAGATGFAYYLPNARQVVVRNPQLQDVTKVELPKELVDSPFISLVQNEVYYSTGNEIRAMNMNTGISRLIRQQSLVTQKLLGVYFDGTVLLCELTDENGGVEQVFISTQTGQTLTEAKGVTFLQTHGKRYFAYWQEGVVEQTVVGTKDAEPQQFLATMPEKSEKGGRFPVLGMNGVLDCRQVDGGLEMSFYNISAGKCTAQVTVPRVHSPVACHSDGSGIWFIATDAEQTVQRLYYWNVTKSTAEGEETCVGPLYTAQNPDTEGLAECKTLTEDFQKKYGVKVLLWQDAIAQTGGYEVVPEHNPAVIRKMMEAMEPLLSQFPEKFLLKTVEAGWIKIALVQRIGDGVEWVQFWEEGDCWILLSADADVIDCLTQGMAYGIDSHVLGNSRDFDTWSELNPKGFKYLYSSELREDSSYLKGNNRAFTDAKALQYPNEDRCRIFYYAMGEGNEDLFRLPILQKKLHRLCTGIREAYGLEKKTEEYIWEQYLENPIVYVPEATTK